MCGVSPRKTTRGLLRSVPSHSTWDLVVALFHWLREERCSMPSFRWHLVVPPPHQSGPELNKPKSWDHWKSKERPQESSKQGEGAAQRIVMCIPPPLTR